ncbi:MAG: hypothetical protein JW894_14475 [Bacteroidales bacterium]|nr:hypothetical protein [Bacteroidales bacterium]
MKQLLWNQIQNHAQRLLSQADRDPDSPSYGSFDRNYWNYKIRDFSSVILQQGILSLDVLYSFNSPDNIYFQKPVIKDLIKAGIGFWSKSQLRSGAFNEYYPNESGFPPTAFSLYAIGLMLEKYPEFIDKNVIISINKAIRWLLKHPEKEALNQESVALSGIIISKNISGVKVNETLLNKRLDQFYNSQYPEGWFNEYGGPDLGYLSVTIDSLWDIYRITEDARALKAIEKATEFISYFISVSYEPPVMINARNTDYLVPFGLSGFGSMNPVAAELSRVILQNISRPGNMFSKTDDRYLSHYIGQSYFRSLLNIEKLKSEQVVLPYKKDTIKYFDGCDIFVKHIAEQKSTFISLRKGGIYSEYDVNGIKSADYGWRYKTGKSIAVTHWQNADYRCSHQINGGKIELVVEGNFTLHRYIKPSPLKHVVLRVLSFIAGNRIMPFLKSLIIFSQKNSKIGFMRKLNISNNTIEAVDSFRNLPGENILYKAPHYSMRHVSSAGRFVEEELLK